MFLPEPRRCRSRDANHITVTGVRGTDGKRAAAGYHGADVDAAGPAIDVIGKSDPWEDLWCYSNPVFTAVAR